MALVSFYSIEAAWSCVLCDLICTT